jgi:hypothetical protein
MMTMHRYMRARIFPIPPMQQLASVRVRLWSDNDIENARTLLPKIANGRKTRYKKQSAKTKAPARVPAPHKTRKPKKK